MTVVQIPDKKSCRPNDRLIEGYFGCTESSLKRITLHTSVAKAEIRQSSKHFHDEPGKRRYKT